jgi:hypothetical protein
VCAGARVGVKASGTSSRRPSFSILLNGRRL